MQDELRTERNVGFFQAENLIIDSEDFTMAEKMAYLTLVRYADRDNKAFPGIATLAKKMGCGETTVRKALKGLEKKGVLRIEERKKADGSRTSNLYTIVGVVNKEEEKQRQEKFQAELEKKVEEKVTEYKEKEEKRVRQEIAEEFKRSIEETIKALEEEKATEQKETDREKRIMETILKRKEMFINASNKNFSDRPTGGDVRRLEENRQRILQQQDS